MLAVLMWLMPQLSPQLRTPDGQVAASTPRKPRVLSSPSSPHSPNAAGPSQAFDEVVEDIAEADAMEIYTAVKPTGKERELEANLPQLTSTLHRHQRRAAAWMVDRERGAQVKKECLGELHPLWRQVTCIDGQIFYVNPFNGLLSRTPFPAPDPVPGGILADEMGMGKTVELLACILAHRFSGPAVPAELERDAVRPKHERIDCMCLVQQDTPSDEGDYTGLWVQCDECQAWLHGPCVGLKKAPKREYICPKCIRAHANATVTVDCGATLIVSPASILQQWQTEIAKHTHPGALKVLVYEHVSSDSIHGAPSRGLSARDFAAADIVLTTYETLQKDVNRQGNIRTYSFRQAKKWCITGTPLSRGLEDLYGLFYFLHARPYSDSFWWHEVLQRPYVAGCPEGRRRLMAQLRPAEGGLFWRTSKADVAHELALPPQSHRTTFLTLSAIERHFYMRQHQECAAKARAVLPTELLTALEAGRAGDEAFRRLTQAEEKSLLKSLLRLRQACCHPQVGSRGIKALTAAKTPMTMDSILEVLVEKARVEAEDAQRILLSALNGLAGLMLIDGDKPQAVALYRQVLATAEANKALIRLDPLQKLHTLSNLADLLKGGSMPGIPRTLRDDSLQADADKIREEYLVQWVAKVAAAEKEYTSALEHMNRPGTGEQSDAATKSAGPPSSGRAAPSSSSGYLSLDEEECWYLDAIDLLLQYTDDQGDRMATAIRDHLAARDEVRRKHEKNATSMARRFSSLAGLQLLLKNELAASATAKEKALKTLEDLTDVYHERPDSLVEQAATCGRCRSELGEAGRVCRHCKMDDVWVAWEIRLFRVETRAMEAGAYVSAEDALRQAQAAMLRHIGRGGLNEEGGVASASDGVPEVGRREGENVSTVDIVRQPSEAEQVLRMLPGQLRSLKHLPPRAVGQRNALLAVAKTALERLEAGRRVFLRGRALALAQRFALYARDELAMSTLRIRVRVPGEHVKPHEVHFKLHPAELPVKNKELTTERIVAEADLNKQLGTLRYLRGLRAARQRMQAATTRNDQASGQQGSSEAPGEADMCPVCQEPLGQELTMLPCGHQLCVRCHMAILDRIPPNTPMAVRHIHCPTCRARTKVADIALVDAGRSAAKEEGQSSALADEEQIPVCGSYSAKVEIG
ncbi:g6581 [Coccomyxa elongata]